MRLISSLEDQRLSWVSLVLVTLGLWLGGSLVVDLLIMPGMYASGKMAESDFVTTGYAMFWLLNRLELLCASVILTGMLVLVRQHGEEYGRQVTILAAILLIIPLLYTYILTPEMTALGAQLDWLGDRLAVPPTMTWLHGSYWGLELLKLGAGIWLFRQVDRGHTLTPS